MSVSRNCGFHILNFTAFIEYMYSTQGGVDFRIFWDCRSLTTEFTLAKNSIRPKFIYMSSYSEMSFLGQKISHLIGSKYFFLQTVPFKNRVFVYNFC
jgi:hypothetical protein